MRFILSLLLILCITASMRAEKYTFDYTGRPMSDALADICRKNPNLKISFIYNELENYRVKAKVNAGDAYTAIRQLTELNPISVTRDGNEIYVESAQKGKHIYTGRAITGKGEPVDFATVILLNPKDSTVYTYGVTDCNGRFSIPCDRRKVIAKFTHVGYKTRFYTTNSFALGNIHLEPKVVNLKNVTATPDYRYVQDDRTVFIPTAREKRAAQGGADLLMFMSLPNVQVKLPGKSISTISGESVTVFIDYVQASEEEIANMRTEDVKRVEVLDFPSDPRFLGVRHAINFIMAKYEYGGYTKISDTQRLDFRYGVYNVASKFSYGKMTYDVYTGYDHFKSDDAYVNSSTDYDFGSRSVHVDRKTLDSRTETNEFHISARVLYSTENTLISNQISLRDYKAPDNLTTLENTFSPSIYPSGESHTELSKSSLTPSWKGTYHFTLPKSIKISVTPSATYAKNTSKYQFAEDGNYILNDVNEYAWKARLAGGVSKTWNRQTVSFSVNGELAGNRLHYSGENPADIDYSYKAIGGFLSANLTFGKFWLQPSCKFFFSKTAFDGRNFYQPLPGYYISGGWNPNEKHRLGISSEMSNWTVGVPQRSPNIVVRDLIDAVQGNPSLKSWLYNSAQIDYTWIPYQWFYIGAYATYTRHTKPMDYKYIPTMIDGREMMLRTNVKDGYFQDIEAGVSATVRLFDNSLTIRGDMAFDAYRRGGSRRYTRNVVNGNLSASYYIGDFYFSAMYIFGNKRASVYTVNEDLPSYYNVSAGWSRNGWNVQAEVTNPFRYGKKQQTEYTFYDNYTRIETYFGSHCRCQFWLKATYTIGYGKKLKADNIGKGSSISSGIVE